MTVALTRWPSWTVPTSLPVELDSWRSWFDVLSQPAPRALVPDPATGRPAPHIADMVPRGTRRMGGVA